MNMNHPSALHSLVDKLSSYAGFRNCRLVRSGMAIVIALFFAFSMMIMFVGLLTMNRQTAGHNRAALQQAQAYFAARAALQHFMMKAKLCPTELYDAVEFTQGKNPLFDFSEFPSVYNGANAFAPYTTNSEIHIRVLPQKELDSKQKPKWFYRRLPGRNDVFIRVGSPFLPEFRFIAPNVVNTDANKKFTEPNAAAYASYDPERYLKYYIQDCTNKPVNSKLLQPRLVMNKAQAVATIRDWSIDRYFSDFEKVSGPERYPYSMFYEVKAVSLGHMKDLRRYNEEAIEIQVIGSIVDFQGKTFTQEQKKVQKITRLPGATP